MKIETIRHSLAHIMALAVQELYPGTKFGIGPNIENGFYYDFDFKNNISSEDLLAIEKKMKQYLKQDIVFKKKLITKAEAKKIFKNQPYKLELLKEMKGKVGTYESDKFLDLCKGPHVRSTKQIPTDGFKLTKLAGAYWRGSEKNKMLTRIYGLAFENKKQLNQHLKQLEEAEKRDHRKLGKELDLFSFHPDAPGDVFWHPKGYIVMRELFKYWREVHEREKYVEVRTPVLLTRKTWDQSGHTKFFLDKMYQVTTPDAKKWDMAVKPMNCDGGMIIYKTQIRSYKDLPIRMGELGVVHRYEGSGETHGLLRVREFTQDDAHIYCTQDQIRSEIKKVIDLCFEFYKTFGLKLHHLELSTRPENSIGSNKAWKESESIMRSILKEKNIPHQINEGDGAFYGPKFDFHLEDTIGRTWQCATIQLDFAQPENFNLQYVTKRGTKKRPVMIHRVVYGSVERFLGILIEHYAGAFPVWLSPIQVAIVPISSKHNSYTKKIEKQLQEKGIRTVVKDENETLGKKIRSAEMQKIPYILVVGDKEVKSNSVNVRQRKKGDLGSLKINKFIEKVVKEIKNKK